NGNGDRERTMGKWNQRKEMSSSNSGVKALTTMIARSTPTKHQRPSRRTHSCNSPCVFKMSHPAPSSAYPNISEMPVQIENGVKQSREPPAKLRPDTSKP